MGKIINNALFISLLLLVIYGFKIDIETEFSDDEMKEIQQEVEARVKAFVKKEKEDCRKELIELADTKADSILMYDFKKLVKNDSLVEDIPARPLPPSKPEILVPNDNTPLQPLIEDEEQIFK